MVKDGAKAFYEGQAADLLVAQMARGARPGLTARADLAKH